MKYVEFTFFFISSLFFITSIAFGAATMGVQPSTIDITLNQQQQTVIIPYKFWNQGNQDINISVTQHDLSEFTNFTTASYELKAGQSRDTGYSNLSIVLKMTSGVKTVSGGLIIKPIFTGSGTVQLIQQIDAKIRIAQDDTIYNNGGVTINTIINSSTSGSSSSSSSSSSSGGGSSSSSSSSGSGVTNTTKPTPIIPIIPKQNTTTNTTNATISNHTNQTENITTTQNPPQNNTLLYVCLGILLLGAILIAYGLSKK